MKKLFYSLFILALATACSQDTLTVKGTIAEGETYPDNALVYLFDGETALDSAAVAEGKFELKAPANPEKIYRISAMIPDRSPRDYSWTYGFIPEKGTYNVTFASKSSNCTIEGSAVNNSYNDLNRQIQDAYNNYREKAKTLAEDARDEAEKLYSETMENVKSLSLDAIRKNANNYIARAALMNVIYELPLEELKELLGKCGKFVAEDNAISRIVGSKEAAVVTGEGKPFVDFGGKTPEGTDVKLSDYVGKGKWVLADFWASWCGPCMAEIPHIKKVYDAFEGNDFMVLGIAVWDGDNTASAKRMEEKEMKWTQIFTGNDSTPTDSYGVLGIPTMILFAPDGTIHKREGLRGEAMYEAVAEVLGK